MPEENIKAQDNIEALFWGGQKKEKPSYEDIKAAVKRQRLNMKGIINSRYYKMAREAQKANLPIMSKNSFVKFSLDTTIDFSDLYENYRQCRYKRHLMPVVQLVDKKKGYIIGNFIWTTLEDKVNSGISIKVSNEDGKEQTFSSVKEAERKLDLPCGVLYKPLRKGGRYKKFKVQLAI